MFKVFTWFFIFLKGGFEPPPALFPAPRTLYYYKHFDFVNIYIPVPAAIVYNTLPYIVLYYNNI